MRARPRLSLKARALAWLAQREHSRAELRRKLMRVARAEQAEAQATAGDATAAAPAATDPQQSVDPLLDWLEQHQYLSEPRFVESRVRARVARYGNLRIRQELAQLGVSPDAATLQGLKDSELERAKAVWQRKFDAPPGDAAERARQMRFLAQRGFSAEVVRRVVGGADE